MCWKGCGLKHKVNMKVSQYLCPTTGADTMWKSPASNFGKADQIAYMTGLNISSKMEVGSKEQEVGRRKDWLHKLKIV